MKMRIFGSSRKTSGTEEIEIHIAKPIQVKELLTIIDEKIPLLSAYIRREGDRILSLNVVLARGEEILKLTDEEMRTCQISRQKGKYLRALSNAVINNELNFEELSMSSSVEVRNKLTSIKGIGDWTTDIYLMFCLQNKDIFPLGDIALITTIKELTRIKTYGGIIRFTEKLKPLRSLAAYFLWYYYLKKRKRI